MISIVTATYNRAHTLPKLYDSLIKNKNYDKSLEWIIIDDGSVDDTKNIVNKWIKENQINIKYFYQTNQGKMAAINNYIKEVNNELCLEVDSDDYLTDTALRIIIDSYTDEIKNNDKCYGILYRRHFIGKENQIHFPKEKIICKMFDLYNKELFIGDTGIVFKSNIRKKYSYELENNEKFVTEARMYNKLDLEFDGIYLIDKEIINCEYLTDGYSKNIDKLFINNPYGYFEYFKECFLMNFKGLSFNKRLYFIKHYILFGCLIKKKKSYLIKNVKGFNKVLVFILIIPGYKKTKSRFNTKDLL